MSKRDVPSESIVAGVPAKVIASLLEYLEKLKKKQMYTAPCAGKMPTEVNRADVESFQNYVYPRMGHNKS